MPVTPRYSKTQQEPAMRGLLHDGADMATNPMMQQPPMADPETQADAAAPGEDQDDGSTELCIKIAQDGTISVYKESGEDEAAQQCACPLEYFVCQSHAQYAFHH